MKKIILFISAMFIASITNAAGFSLLLIKMGLMFLSMRKQTSFQDSNLQKKARKVPLTIIEVAWAMEMEKSLPISMMLAMLLL